MGSMIQENPFEMKFAVNRKASSFSIVIFGASGDLTRRKLIPALFNLYLDGFITEPFNIIGFARRDLTGGKYKSEMAEAVRSFSRRQPQSEEQLERFTSNIDYVSGSFDNPNAYDQLKVRIRTHSLQKGMPVSTLFYLSTPPASFEPIVGNLSRAGLVSRNGDGKDWSRIVVEKPFGHDQKSAWQLNGAIHSVFSEEQVYRIDHYLGKETVQNLLVFRLGNSIFEPLWNRRYVDNIQISVAESLGIGTRAGYFDNAGIIRDMIQSHIMQVLALVLMEPPASFDTNAIRDEKAKVLRALRPIKPGEIIYRVVRGQYATGSIGGERVKGYLEEEAVPKDSKADTYVALRLNVDNWRWSDVPIYIRSGKRLPKRATEVAITFKEPPHLIFERTGCEPVKPNILRIRIQPQEGISLSLGAKVPGQAFEIESVRMDFMYASSFGAASPEAYERLILDAITGDSTLFSREDEVDLSWQFIDRIVTHWNNLPLHLYDAGEWGPSAADEMIAEDGRAWHRL